MDFGTLTLVVACGLVGPLLAGAPRLGVPVVAGQLAAGLVVGVTGFGVLDPEEPTLAFLAQVGFALLMFSVGTNLPLRDARLRPAVGRGLVLTAATAALAVPAGFAAAAVTGLDEPVLMAVLAGSGSAAVVMPALVQSGGIGTGRGLVLAVWVTATNIAAIVALPFATEGDDTAAVAIGGVAVFLATVLCWRTLHALRGSAWFRRYRRLSKRRRWGLDLQVSLLMLFGLTYMAVELGTNVIVAGFSAGVVVAALGEPRRLGWQVLGLAEGFLVPLFFVVLGARLDLRALADDPDALVLAGALAVAAVAVHLAVAVGARLPVSAGLVAAAQLGVPAAAVTTGLDAGLLDPAEAAAVMAAALVCVALFALGARALPRALGVPPDEAGAVPAAAAPPDGR